MTRIEAARLREPGTQLGQLLSHSSGIQQRHSGGFGTFSSVTVRTASAAQTGVYLDGILLNSGGEAVVDLSTLEILNLAAVDIYKGAAPLQLGHASIGGAVNLNTLDAPSNIGSSLRLGVGSFGQASLSASYQNTSGPWDWTSSLSHRQSDNDFAFFDDMSPTTLTLGPDNHVWIGIQDSTPGFMRIDVTTGIVASDRVFTSLIAADLVFIEGVERQ